MAAARMPRGQSARLGDDAPLDGAGSSGGRFISERPALAMERAAASPLFSALEALRARLEPALAGCDLASRLDAELARFFDDALAPAVQQRESALVSDLYAHFERELEARAADVRALESQLEHRVQEETAQLRAQLDRRVTDTNALRKEYYKQLLMLRDMVSRQKSDPKTLSAVNDAISSASGANKGNDAARNAVETAGTHSRQLPTLDARCSRPDAARSLSMRREREKWEQRVHEASVEAQQLRDQVAALRQQVELLRQNESSMWFLDAKSGVGERQRVIDAVYKAKCTWEDVGGSIVELLNNDVVWGAVERTVRVKTVRAPRGLEALITELDAMHVSAAEGRRRNSSGLDDRGPESGGTTAALLLRRLSSDGGDRLIPCRACNGAGYISANGGADEDDSDSYLRRTLVQVLDLKAALDQANTHSNEVEQELQTTLACYAQLQGKLERIDAVKRLRVGIAVQADLDEEDEQQALNAATDGANGSVNWASAITRKSKRVQLYERLISELKRSLVDKDAGIKELRAAVESSQSRLVAVQKQSQQEQETLKREISALKSSLALSMKHRNSNIDEKQAAVKFLLKRLTSEQRQMALRQRSIPSQIIKEEQDHEDTHDDGNSDQRQGGAEDTDALSDGESSDEEHEIERSEKVARRYSESVDRVQQEFQEHQSRMREIDEEIKGQEEKRKRTNSIALGSIVVTMSSHPRDLFKALSTAHGELSKLRRSSQQSSTLQADRLLTLTTHLSHISEELCMVRKRTKAEIEYWRLECEKLQNANSALITEQQGLQQRLGGMQDQMAAAVAAAAAQSCSMCAKHQARLADISNWMIANEAAAACPADQQGSGSAVESTSSAVQLTERVQPSLSVPDQRAISGLVLEIEQVCGTMNSSTQEAALTLLGRAIFGNTGRSLPPSQVGGILGSKSRVPSLETAQSKRYASSVLSLTDRSEPVAESDQPRELQSSRRSRSAPSRRDVISESRRATAYILSPHSEAPDSLGTSAPSNGIERATLDYSDSRPGIGGLLAVRGRAVSNAPSYYAGNRLELSKTNSDVDQLPSLRRKKTVKKLLSHQEFERWCRRRPSYDCSTYDVQEVKPSQDSSKSVDDCDPRPEEPGTLANNDTPYTIFSDEKGEDIYCVQVEESDDDDGDRADGDAISPRDDSIPQAMPIAHPRILSVGDQRLDRGSFASLDPSGENQQLHDFTSGPAKTTGSPVCSNETDAACARKDDPPVIQQLRTLLSLNDAAREKFAVANWECLVSLIRLATSQSRLATFAAETRSRDGTPPNPPSPSRAAKVRIGQMREALAASTQLRELTVEQALAARHDAKRECRRLHAHFMHTIATMMTTLSQKNRHGKVLSGDSSYLSGQYDSAPVSPSGRAAWSYYSRPLYPAAQVNLGYLPQTQQLFTPSFPIGVEPGSASPRMTSSPSSRQLPRSEIRTPDVDTSTSFDPSSPDQRSHAAFPHRVIKFVGQCNPFDYSLTHSTSTLCKVQSQLIEAFSPTPTKSTLTHPSSSNGTACPLKTLRQPERPVSASESLPDSQHLNPTRPQSSPSAVNRVLSPRQREPAGFR